MLCHLCVLMSNRIIMLILLVKGNVYQLLIRKCVPTTDKEMCTNY